MELGKLYALTAGILWGITPVFFKMALRGASVRVVIVISSMCGFLMLVGLGLVQGMHGWFSLPLEVVGMYVVIGLTGSMFARIFSIKGIEKIGGARSTSIANASPLLTMIFAIFILGEHFTAAIGVGVALVMSGIYFISFQRSGDGPRQFRRIDVLWPLGAALCYSFNPLLKRISMMMTPSPLIGVFYTNGTSMIIFTASFLAQRAWNDLPAVAPRYFLYIVIAGLSTALGNYMTFLAVLDQPIIIASSIWRLSPLITLALSYVLLRDSETLTIKDALGTFAIVGGVYILVRWAN